MKKNKESSRPGLQRGWAWLLAAVLFWTPAPRLFAFHFPWDQGHDTFQPDPPPDPGPCDEANCTPCNSTRSPVYLTTGHFVWSDEDVFLRGRPTMAIVRTYNSNEGRMGVFGTGWSFNNDVALYHATDGTGASIYILRLASGKRYEFAAADSTSIPAGEFGHIEPQQGGGAKLVAADGGVREFGSDGKIRTETDTNGNRLSYSYSNDGRLTQMADTSGRSLALSYDARGMISSVTDSASRTWSYAYDDLGSLLTVTDPLGGVRRYEYQSFQPSGGDLAYRQLTQITDAAGVVVTKVRYQAERVVSYTEGADLLTYSYDSGNRSVVKVDSLGSRWTYVYDENGLIVRETDPMGQTVSSAFDSDGRLIRFTDELGYDWQYAFDALGRETSYTTPLGDTFRREYEGDLLPPRRTLSPSGRQTVFDYDSKGNLTTITDAADFVTRVEWSQSGEPVAVVDAAGNRTTLAFNDAGLLEKVVDPSGRTLETTYDGLGRQVEFKNGLGAITRIEYDALDRVIRRTNPLGAPETYSYDPAGRVLSVTNANGGVTAYSYDAFGRLQTEVNAGGGVTRYAYRSDNLVSSITRPDGSVVLREYDAAGRVRRDNAGGDVIDYVYDARGDVVLASNAVGAVTRVYDASERLVSESTSGKVIESDYNGEGERTQMRAFGHTTDYRRDQRGLLTGIQTAQGSYELAYDSLGRRIRLDLASGIGARYEYNAAGDLVRLQLVGGVAETYNYTFDASGGIIQIQRGGAPLSTYQFDLAGRLVRAEQNGTQFNYTYDAVGNWVQAGGVYDAANRLISDATNAYAYDDRGNLVQETDRATGAVTRFAWNGRNQLISVQRFASATSSTPVDSTAFAYGPLGRRWSADRGGVVEQYVYDGLDRIGTLGATGELMAEVTFGPTIDEPLAETTAQGTHFYQSDHLGSIVGVVDSGGSVIGQYDYGPFGQTDPNAQAAGAFRYAGRESETGDLYYFRARYYQPSTGRFLSPDPVSAALGGSVNGYSYADNDPVNFIDNLGLAKGGKQNVRDSGLRDVSDDEISRRARDPSLSPEERRRYQKEEKARGLRNKQKRGNKDSQSNRDNQSVQFCPLPQPSPNLLPWIIVGVIVIGGIIILSGGVAAPAAGAFASDKRRKEDFEEVDVKSIMKKVAELPVSSWRYIGENPDRRHIGPMAQDFHAKLGLGDNDREIAFVDANGVLYAAFRGLYAEIERLRALTDEQARRIEALEGLAQREESRDSPQSTDEQTG